MPSMAGYHGFVVTARIQNEEPVAGCIADSILHRILRRSWMIR